MQVIYHSCSKNIIPAKPGADPVSKVKGLRDEVYLTWASEGFVSGGGH